MFKNYIKEISYIFNTNEHTEHSFRSSFQNLLESYSVTNNYDATVIHEPSRQNEYGSPDFKITSASGSTIGFIECKKANYDIESLIESDQVKKYLQLTNNLIITNYTKFILIKNGEIEQIESLCSLYTKVKTVNSNGTEELFEKFFTSKPSKITTSEKLSITLANRTRLLKNAILLEMEEDKNPFYPVQILFKNIIPDINRSSFVDVYSQIISFGLLFFKLSNNKEISRTSILNEIPHYIPLLRDVFHNAQFHRWGKSSKWILDEIFDLLNNIDSKLIKESLSYKYKPILKMRDKNLKDPFIYFYETFLETYDKDVKIQRGVFYTPESVVSYIINSLDFILKKKIGIKKGFLDDSIKVLDFATGTGTFILALIEYIKDSLWKTNNYGLFNYEVNEFILENVYGFELLAVPYIICHLRIHEYLESHGFHYTGNEIERAEVYLTNTLANDQTKLSGYFADIDEEIELARKVKENEELLVIMGNPPYSVSSSNKTDFIENLMKSYKVAVSKEKNIQPLSDDYIKFLRFAHWKMENVNKGVIGVITNNGFIDGIIHRGIREELIKTFDEIYILDLHGNSNIGECCPDGSVDQNVFEIKQGVCISFFIKTGKKNNKNKGVYYSSLQGSQKNKYNYLYTKTFQDTDFEKIKASKPYFWLKKQHFNGEAEYKKGISLLEIFNKNSAGIKTARDALTIHFNKETLKKTLNDFTKLSPELITEKYNLKDSRDWKVHLAKQDVLKYKESDDNIYKIMYRPFDIRYTFYTGESKGFMESPRNGVMENLLNDNIALLSGRMSKSKKITSFFCTNLINELKTAENTRGSYCFPLYIFSENSKEYNYTDKFKKRISKMYPNFTLEHVFPYLYAILFSNSYREKYNELLKIDFPKIIFVENEDLFKKISKYGEHLIELHLLKYCFDTDISSFPVRDANMAISKVQYDNSKIYINSTTYFDSVPIEVWEYTIGGYKILDKWLKARKQNRLSLTFEDIKYFINLINVIYETIKTQSMIDSIVQSFI